ncbi:RNA polymerase sigma factor [Sorangium sp. So ce1151]|uniref:RNA polymerase sigma factor n=1 Tax=Sorangium sp. So ce1151 TaxID=3133332 RepID=UPI003F621C4F
MRRRRRGANRPPAAPKPPPAEIKPEAIVAQSKGLRAVLAGCGVPARDLDDVLQECLIGAIVAVREGRYRPAPAVDPAFVLRRWLVGIAVRQAAKYHEKAYRRREVAVADPLAHAAGQEQSPHAQVEARALLKLLWLVHPRERTVLVLVSTGELVTEVARRLDLPGGTAFSRLRRGRKRFAAVLARSRSPLR